MFSSYHYFPLQSIEHTKAAVVLAVTAILNNPTFYVPTFLVETLLAGT
jgi:hypothetical protein